MGLRPLAVALLVTPAVALLVLPGLVAAQGADEAWRVRSARMEIVVADGSAPSGDGAVASAAAAASARAAAEIRMWYELGGVDPETPPPTGPIPFGLLGFGAATADDVEVVGRGAVVLWPASGRRREAMIPPGRPTDRTVSLELRYRVEQAVAREGAVVHARIPVLVGPPVSADVVGRGFEVELRLPASWRVSETFPAGMVEAEGGSHAGALQVVPAMISFRGRTDGVWRPGLPTLIDAVTLLVLLGFAGFGWRHLRGVARGARS